MKNPTRRQAAIIRRRKFVLICGSVLVISIAAIILSVTSIVNNLKSDADTTSSTPSSSKTETVSDVSSDVSSEPSKKVFGLDGKELDPKFTMLLLVNGKNPLPDDYDSNVRADLVEIDPEYRNNNYVTKIHKDVYPYITAMVAAAQAEGVDLKVWSPFRSYADQKVLFENQVNRVGGDEDKAATVVARPGTSEHNTGICADFNMASDSFADTPMYTWMTKNAEDYGFVMRYEASKQSITGVIHESWHWRFVGIDAAKEMNKLGMCLEEYVEYKNKQFKVKNSREVSLPFLLSNRAKRRISEYKLIKIF